MGLGAGDAPRGDFRRDCDPCGSQSRLAGHDERHDERQSRAASRHAADAALGGHSRARRRRLYRRDRRAPASGTAAARHSPTKSSSSTTAAPTGPWRFSADHSATMPELRPLRNTTDRTVSAARSSMVSTGFRGDAVVIMMADESDDCRDVVAYWRMLQRRVGLRVRQPFHPRRRSHRLPVGQARGQPPGEPLDHGAIPDPVERHDECLQGVSPNGHRRMPPVPGPPFQPHDRASAEGDRPRLFVDDDSDYVAKSSHRRREAEAARKWAAGISSS